MENVLIVYVLLFSSILNTILLLVLAGAFLKMVALLNNYGKRITQVIDRGEKEFYETLSSLRKVLDYGSYYMKSGINFAEKFFVYKTFNSKNSKTNVSNIITGIGVGYSLFKNLKHLFSKNNK